MSYSKSSSEKFTLIDDLLDLDDPKEETTNNNNYKDILPNGQEDKFAKFIRQQHKSKYEENERNTNIQGMNSGYPQGYSQGYSQQDNMNSGYPQGYSQGYSQQDNINGGYDNKESYVNSQNPYSIPSHSPYSCLDIAGHIENCPICSKFYNNDKSVYIIAIVILVIICIILLKKVLDK